MGIEEALKHVDPDPEHWFAAFFKVNVEKMFGWIKQL
jgi:hypothetical protein